MKFRAFYREAGENPVKRWRNSHNCLSKKEKDVLHKGVQYFGTRFDLIQENLLTGRTEEELRKAYEKFRAASKQVWHVSLFADVPRISFCRYDPNLSLRVCPVSLLAVVSRISLCTCLVGKQLTTYGERTYYLLT